MDIVEPEDAAAVVRLLAQLRDEGIDCALFGGWAEEAWGLCLPRRHADIDLLLDAPSFHALDRLLSRAVLRFCEIRPKRFAHKRAFRTEGVTVEGILVEEIDGRPVTLFWGDIRFDWLPALATPGTLAGQMLQIVTPENLARYRAEHRSIQPWRWKDPSSRR